jgi:hypothetical protein
MGQFDFGAWSEAIALPDSLRSRVDIAPRSGKRPAAKAHQD